MFSKSSNTQYFKILVSLPLVKDELMLKDSEEMKMKWKEEMKLNESKRDWA